MDKKEILKQLLLQYPDLQDNLHNLSIKNNQLCLFDKKIKLDKDLQKQIKENFDKDEVVINPELYKIFCDNINKVKSNFPNITFQHNSFLYLNHL